MKWYQKFSLVLAAMMCCSAVACSHGSDSDKSSSGGNTVLTPIQPVTEPEQHLVTNGLHKVSVTETDRVFTSSGKTEYQIVLDGTDSNAVKAAAFLQQHIRAATGAMASLIREPDEVTWSNDAKYIVVNVPELFAQAGLSMPEDDLGQTGYYIKNAGNSVFIAVNSVNGVHRGAISFLKHVLGYEMYAADTVVYEKSGATLPDMEIIERPDFEFYVQGNSVSSEATYGMGFDGSIFIPVEGETWHNSFNYLPPETYKSQHPDWYSTKGNELCYTAHGNEAEFNAMAKEIAKKIIALLPKYPTTGNITVTIEDHNDQCDCAACQASREKYNGADSAGVIKLCNAVNRIVQDYLEGVAEKENTEKRDFNILFFAYNKMEKPPVKKNAAGQWEPIDETVICDENVGVYIAPISAAYNQSFYHDDNTSERENISGWAVLSENLYMWLYETNYSHYLYPINTWDTMIETYRFCKASGAVYMFNEGQYNQGNVTHFSKLKEYFNAKAEFDVNVNYNEVVDDFFKNYFKDAEAPMRQFFDELQAHMRWLETAYPADVNGNIYNNMEQAKLWPKKTLDHWLELIDEAYASIEHYRTENPDLYAVLEEHILLESMFPRFALIRLYPGKYSAETLFAMQTEFRDDCQALKITMLSEGGSLDEVFSSWGL